MLLADGRVLVAGGGLSAEVIDVGTGASVTVQRYDARRSFATVSPLGTGDVLVLGGYDDEIGLGAAALLLSPDSFP